MTTLAASVDASEELWTVDALPITEYVQVGSEVVRVIADFAGSVYRPTGALTPPKIRVARGQSGTTAATHTQGAAITAAYIPGTGTGGGSSVPDPATGNVGDVPTVNAGQDAYELAAPSSGAQTIRVLGPFPITFESVGIVSTGGAPATLGDGGKFQVTPLPDGAILLDAWAEIGTPFVGAAGINFDIQPLDDPDRSSDIFSGGEQWAAAQYQDTTAVGVFAVAKRGDGSTASTFHLIARAISGAALMIYLSDISTVGEADIYALIAEPV